MSFQIFTDTSANLPGALAEEKSLRIIPFTYRAEGKEMSCTDPEDFDGDGFYERIRKGLTVTTSQVTPQTYIDSFRPVLEAGRDILFISMSSGISGSFASSAVAAAELGEEFPERHIELVDTMGASLGEGLIALKAAEYRDDGIDLLDTALLLRDMSGRMCQIFTVDDLMHLRRGGRLSNLSAVVGTVLNIKPLLKGNEEGKIVAFRKVRGRRSSINAIAELYARLVRSPEKQTVGIAQAGCREDAELLRELISKMVPAREILSVQYEPVTGAHVGPGALALFFLGDDNVRQAL